MADKEMIINGVDVSECVYYRDDVYADKQIDNACSIGLWQRHYSGLEENCKKYCECKNNPNCYFKQRARAKKEIEELRRYHNKCCEENTEKLKQWSEKYNQLSRDFYNGKYCNKKNCSLLKAKEQECEEYKKKFSRFFNIDNQECWNIAFLNDEKAKYKQALDEIEEFCTAYSDNHDTYETVYKQILDIISKSEEV